MDWDKVRNNESSFDASRAKRGDDIHKVTNSFEIYNLNFETRLQFEKEKLDNKEKVWE